MTRRARCSTDQPIADSSPFLCRQSLSDRTGVAGESAETRQALETWLEQKPDAAIVIAAIEEMSDDALDVAMRLSAITGYHVIGLMHALIEETNTSHETLA